MWNNSMEICLLILLTYPSSIPSISQPNKNTKRVQDIEWHEFLSLVITTKGLKVTLKDEVAKWFSIHIGLIDDDYNVFS